MTLSIVEDVNLLTLTCLGEGGEGGEGGGGESD